MSFLIENYLNSLFNDINTYIKEVKQELEKLLDNIKKYLGICDSFKEAINNYLKYLELLNKFEDKTQYKNKELMEELTKIYKLYIEQNTSLKDNFDFIEKKNKNIDSKYNDFINYDFCPDSSVNIKDINQNALINNSSNNRKNTPVFFESYLKENDNYEDLNNNNEKYKCSTCLEKKAIVFSTKKRIFYCEACFNNYIENNNNNIDFDKDIISLENITNRNNENIKSYIKSVDILLKNILMRCDFILNNEELVSIMDGNNQIKILDYPNIKNENEDCLDFLKQIYNISNDINHKTFNITNLNKGIIAIVRGISGSINIQDINNRNINSQSINNQNIIDQTLDNVDDKYDSDDGSFDEKYVQNESLKIGPGKYLFFSINSILKSNSETDIRNKLTNILIQNFNIINEDIFISFNDNNKIIFIDNFIKTKKILDLSIDDIKKLYPNLDVLYEYKNIFDSLIKEYNIQNYIDYRGNFIIQNMKETREKYYPPYEWIGIGLKVLGKYENDNWLTDNSKNNEWAIAYHGVGGKLSIPEVKNKLKMKIKEGLKQGKSQRQCNLYDYRHPGKRIGTGVYLTSNINKVEDFSGIIQLNKKKYRVALMSKVKIDKIRQAINSNTWILNPKYIRIYRILLKKI